MKIIAMCALVVAATIIYCGQVVAGTLSHHADADSIKRQGFKVFDATLYKSKPDMLQYGINPIKIFYEWELWVKWKNNDLQNLPRENDVKHVAQDTRNTGAFGIINIEHWPLRGEDSVVQESLRKYRTVLKWFHEAVKEVKFGYYGAPPVVDYWRAVNKPESEEHRSWRRDNTRIEPLAHEVDAFFPSAYTFYIDQAGWQKYAIAQIEAARAYDNKKPVYVFLWPQFHESNRLLGGSYLSAEYWKMEMETGLKHADGIVIWGGWQQEWDENAAWWQVTKDFMKKINKAN